MIRMHVQTDSAEICYHGARMTAEEYLSLGETEIKYELIDGVVIMSPSARFVHQKIITRLGQMIANFVDDHPCGEVCAEVDVDLSAASGRHLVYRPDLVFLNPAHAECSRERITGAPDLVVEVISPESRRYDSVTKKGDYERCGVREYWLIDPLQDTMTFYILERNKFTELHPAGDTLASRAIPGFELDLARVRRLFDTDEKQ